METLTPRLPQPAAAHTPSEGGIEIPPGQPPPAPQVSDLQWKRLLSLPGLGWAHPKLEAGSAPGTQQSSELEAGEVTDRKSSMQSKGLK